MFTKILHNVEDKTPLVHCITNYVSVNDCANILLACGASPIMADDIKEVRDITFICGSLYINIGTLNERTIQSMKEAGKKANELSHPVVLDPVGAGASPLRTSTTSELLEEVRFSVIRGNISEIKAVGKVVSTAMETAKGLSAIMDTTKALSTSKVAAAPKGVATPKGVDANAVDAITSDNLSDTIEFAKRLSETTGAVIAITGAVDIVADSGTAFVIYNGNALMSKVTGTGCMLTAVIAAFCAANPGEILIATAAAVCAMGLCGELAYEKLQKCGGGTATYRTYLIDCMSQMTADVLMGGAKFEIR